MKDGRLFCFWLLFAGRLLFVPEKISGSNVCAEQGDVGGNFVFLHVYIAFWVGICYNERSFFREIVAIRSDRAEKTAI